jgi:hypothetical protein
MELIIFIIIVWVLCSYFSTNHHNSHDQDIDRAPKNQNKSHLSSNNIPSSETTNKNSYEKNRIYTNVSEKEIQGCINEGRDIQFTYQDEKGDITERIVTPQETYWGNSQRLGLGRKKIRTCYLEAFCHLRNDERTFILERMSHMKVL